MVAPSTSRGCFNNGKKIHYNGIFRTQWSKSEPFDATPPKATVQPLYECPRIRGIKMPNADRLALRQPFSPLTPVNTTSKHQLGARMRVFFLAFFSAHLFPENASLILLGVTRTREKGPRPRGSSPPTRLAALHHAGGDCFSSRPRERKPGEQKRGRVKSSSAIEKVPKEGRRNVRCTYSDGIGGARAYGCARERARSAG